MVGGYSQSTDDLFAPDFFAIPFVTTGQPTESFNRSKQRQQSLGRKSLFPLLTPVQIVVSLQIRTTNVSFLRAPRRFSSQTTKDGTTDTTDDTDKPTAKWNTDRRFFTLIGISEDLRELAYVFSYPCHPCYPWFLRTLVPGEGRAGKSVVFISSDLSRLTMRAA